MLTTDKEPGGYLQWDELVPWDFQFLSIRGSPTEALRKFETMSRENMNRAGRTQKYVTYQPHAPSLSFYQFKQHMLKSLLSLSLKPHKSF